MTQKCSVFGSVVWFAQIEFMMIHEDSWDFESLLECFEVTSVIYRAEALESQCFE